MDEIKEVVDRVLESSFLMSLATVDDGGVWVSDVMYVRDGYNLYWLSHAQTRHSQALVKNPNVAIAVTFPGTPPQGVQAPGTAKQIDTPALEIVNAMRAKRNMPALKEGEPLPNEAEEEWYVFKPTKFDVICAPKWGFKKQQLEL